MKVLIIGASGLLAKPVVNELDQRGHELRLFSRNVKAAMFSKDHEIINGDVFDPEVLQQAIKGCDAIHISLSGLDEAKAVMGVLRVAKEESIKLISTVSGCTVAEENRWFPMIDNKFRAEQAIEQSGIPYMIFRATWFFESLELMVRNNKATIIGKQNNPYHWIAAKDYARMVGEAYANTKARNKVFYVLGEKSYLMKPLMEEFCAACHPEIKKVGTVPTGILKLIATLTGNKALKGVAEMFRYFEQTEEMGDPTETYALLGKPEISFEEWLRTKA